MQTVISDKRSVVTDSVRQQTAGQVCNRPVTGRTQRVVATIKRGRKPNRYSSLC